MKMKIKWKYNETINIQYENYIFKMKEYIYYILYYTNNPLKVFKDF